MSDPHGAAPDPIDTVYAQSEALLDDATTRAARRAQVLATVDQAPAGLPLAEETARTRSPWRRGGWLAAASVAVFCGFLAMRLYEPIHPRLPGAQLAPSASEPLAKPPAADQSIAEQDRASPLPPERPRAPAAIHRASRPPEEAPRLAVAPTPPIQAPASPPRLASPEALPPPAPPPPPPLSAPAPQQFARADANSSVGEVVVTGSRIARRDRPQHAEDSAKLRDAAAAGRTEEVQALLLQGVAVDAPDWRGTTALMKSIQAGHPETAELLMRHGAELDLQDHNGVSARDMALKKADPELNQALGLTP